MPHSIQDIMCSFSPTLTVEALRKYLAEVANVAPEVPFYYYHIPAVTGVDGECC